MKARDMTVIGLIVTSCGFAQSPDFPRSAVLSTEAIAEAMALGVQGLVAPYELETEFGRPPNQKIAIYTPFVRVAMFAMATRLRGRDLTAATIPSWVHAPVVYIVFGSPCPGPGTLRCEYRGIPFDETVPVRRVGVGPKVSSDSSSMAWTDAERVTDNLDLLEALGGVPFDNALLIAIFQPASLKPGLSLWAEWHLPHGIRVFSGGRITERDVRRWR